MKKLHSPFPGMDPFLEHPADWRGVHTRLIVEVSNLLRESLPGNFRVKIEGRVQIAAEERASTIFPDAYLIQSSRIREEQPTSVAIAPSTKIMPLFRDYAEERWLEIIDRQNREVVTVIEILSPFNKVGRGFEDFSKKRERVLYSDTNWVEIDLLRAGKRPIALYDKQLTDYYALAGRAEAYELDLWEMPLQKRLVTIGIPLTDGYEDAPLDLQAAIDKVYVDGEYGWDIDYDGEVPAPQLSAEKEQWVRAQIAQWREAHRRD